MDPELVAGPASDILDTPGAGPAAIRGSTWRVIGYLAGLMLGIASSAIMFRQLGLHETGQYGAATSLIAIVAGLSDLGLTAIGVRELSVRDAEGRNRLARNLLGLRIVTSVVGVTAVAGFALGVGYGTPVVIGVACAGVGLLFQSCQSTLAIALLADLRIGWVAVFDFLRGLLTASLIVVLVVVGAHLVPFLAVSIPVGMVVFALNARVVRGRIPLVPTFHASEWGAILRGALPYTLAIAAATLYTQVALIEVSLIANGRALGYFTVSTRAVQLLLVLPGLAIGTALPIFARAARDDRARLAYALTRTFEVSFLLGVWVALALAVGARMAVTIYGPTFSRSVPLLAIQGTGLGAAFVGAVWANGLLSLGRYRLILAINVVALIIGAVWIAVLVSIDGARGAAIASAAWEGAVAVLGGLALARADRQLRPSLRIVPKVALAAGLAALTTVIDLPVLVSVFVASAVYVAVAIALRAIPPEVAAEVRRLRRSAV